MNQSTPSTAYDRLSQMIPSDIALAAKAFSTALQQIPGVSNSDLPTLARTVQALKTNADLPGINQQTEPTSAATRTYILTNYGAGSGPCGTLTMLDCLATATGGNAVGWVNAVTTNLKSINAGNVINCYNTTRNVVAGVYTQTVNPTSIKVVIPTGTPGAGTYGPYANATLAINDAITRGMIPATRTALAAASGGAAAAACNTNSNKLLAQLANEQFIQTKAGLDAYNLFANVQSNSYSAVTAFAMSLPQYGQDTQQGGAAQVLEILADYTPVTCQVTAGSAVLSGLSNVANIVVSGRSTDVSGNGIVANTYVAAYTKGSTSLTMNQAANISFPSGNVIIGNIGSQAMIALMRTGENQMALNNAGITTQSDIPLTPNPAPTPAKLLPGTYSVQQALSMIKF